VRAVVNFYPLNQTYPTTNWGAVCRLGDGDVEVANGQLPSRCSRSPSIHPFTDRGPHGHRIGSAGSHGGNANGLVTGACL
jgi:hypothetical protein